MPPAPIPSSANPSRAIRRARSSHPTRTRTRYAPAYDRPCLVGPSGSRTETPLRGAFPAARSHPLPRKLPAPPPRTATHPVPNLLLEKPCCSALRPCHFFACKRIGETTRASLQRGDPSRRRLERECSRRVAGPELSLASPTRLAGPPGTWTSSWYSSKLCV